MEHVCAALFDLLGKAWNFIILGARAKGGGGGGVFEGTKAICQGIKATT